MPNKHVRVRPGSSVADAKENGDWVDRELADCSFEDERLGKRLRSLLSQLSSAPGGSIPLACQDWANTKAAYRFLDNDRVSEAQILAGHFQATQERASATDGPILVLHDTTEFSFKRGDTAAVGLTRKAVVGAYRDGSLRYYAACGIFMHSSLVITTEGLPLGLASIKFWNRDKFKGTNALKRSVNPTRVPIETKESIRWLENLRYSTNQLGDPDRCVHIGDRESDIYELFCTAQDIRTHFVLRTCVDRLAGDGEHTVASEMAEVRCKGLHRIDVLDRHGNPSEAVLELKFRRIRILPPIGKQSRYPELLLTVLHATERGKPRGREPIVWKLITDLPVTSRALAIEKLNWYAMRWKIETFHKIMKSGCRIEQSKLRTAERLVNLLATSCLLGWRIFWLTMLNRSMRKAPPTLAFTSLEINLLSRLGHPPLEPNSAPSLNECVTRLAKLGGYLARASDGPPGNMVIWRGMSRLTDIEIGFLLGSQGAPNCG